MTVRKSLFDANGHGGAAVTTKGRSTQAVEQWDSYIDAAGILRALGCGHWSGDLIEFGCGYGTFTISAAQRVSGTVQAVELDPLMVGASKGGRGRVVFR